MCQQRSVSRKGTVSDRKRCADVTLRWWFGDQVYWCSHESNCCGGELLLCVRTALPFAGLVESTKAPLTGAIPASSPCDSVTTYEQRRNNWIVARRLLCCWVSAVTGVGCCSVGLSVGRCLHPWAFVEYRRRGALRVCCRDPSRARGLQLAGHVPSVACMGEAAERWGGGVITPAPALWTIN